MFCALFLVCCSKGSALWWACNHGVAGVVELLLCKGRADERLPNRADLTPLEAAQINGNHECAAMILVRVTRGGWWTDATQLSHRQMPAETATDRGLPLP